MKKEDLLLVFEFLATALKQDVVEEKSIEPIVDLSDYVYNGNYLNKVKYDPEDEAEYNKSELITEKTETIVEEPKISENVNSLEDFKEIREETKSKFNGEKWFKEFKENETSTEILPTDNSMIRHIKTEAVRVKEIMNMIDGDKVFPKKQMSPELAAIDKVLKEHQRNVSTQISLLETKLRDSIATPEQRNLFKEFVKMEHFKSVKELNRIEYFLDNPKLKNPYVDVNEDKVPDEPKEEAKVLPDFLKRPNPFEFIDENGISHITNPGIPGHIPTSISVKFEDGQIKFKEEFKHGLGPNKKFGIDGQEIKK